jgi:hypothetical protein
VPAGRGADEWEGCPQEVAASRKDAGGRPPGYWGRGRREGRLREGTAATEGRWWEAAAAAAEKATGGRMLQAISSRLCPTLLPQAKRGCCAPDADCHGLIVRRTQTAMTFPCAPDASLAASLALFRCHARLREAVAGLWLPRIASSPQESAAHLHGSTRSDSPAAAWILLGCKQKTHRF